MKLKTVFRPDGHTAALRDQTIKPKTFEVDYVDVPVLIQAFRRMVRGLEYDICEMAITTYICAKLMESVSRRYPFSRLAFFTTARSCTTRSQAFVLPKILKAGRSAFIVATPSRPA